MSREPNREGDARSRIEAAIGRRTETFALSHLAWTTAGYTLKFRLGIVDLVRTTPDEGVFEDETRLNKLLDGVRNDFASLLGRSRPLGPPGPANVV
jgi:hypothetical protein